MAWYRQATSHYLSQCWPRSMSPNSVTRSQRVKICDIFLKYQWSKIIHCRKSWKIPTYGSSGCEASQGEYAAVTSGSRTGTTPGEKKLTLDVLNLILKTLPSDLSYKAHLRRLLSSWLLRWSWSIACRHCSNYIFILDLTPSFNELGKDSC